MLYPEHLRGLLLGRKLSAIRLCNYFRSHREEFELLGIDFKKRKKEFQDVKEALVIYKQLHGDLLVPQAYKISNAGTSYPEHLHGMSLGIIVRSIRAEKAFDAHRKELENIGFIYDLEQYEVGRIKEALRIYKALYGNIMVPFSFAIGLHDPCYPKHLRGMKIGSILFNIRHKGQYKRHREDFIAVGVDFVRMRKRKFEEYM